MPGASNYLQKILCTVQCLDVSYWQEQPPPSVTPAFLDLTSTEIYAEKKVIKLKILAAECNPCEAVCMWAHPRYANLLDDILTFILFGFYQDCFSK